MEVVAVDAAGVKFVFELVAGGRLYTSSRAEYFMIKLCISFRFASRSDNSPDAAKFVGVFSSSISAEGIGEDFFMAAGFSSPKGISIGYSFKAGGFLSTVSLLPVRWGLVDLRGRKSEWFDLWRRRYADSRSR